MLAPSNQPFCASSIIGTGSYMPEKILTNDDLSKIVETNDEWITSRTGIKERRIAAADQATSDMASEAARRAMADAGVTAEDIQLIIVATVTPDMFFPSTACFVQKKIGATNAVCFDISAACSGFLYALQVARHFINTGNRTTALVIGAEKLSSLINWQDRNTCVLFGDGAGAVVIRRNRRSRINAPGRVLSTVMGSDGNLADLLKVPGGGFRLPDHAGKRRIATEHHPHGRPRDLQTRRHPHAGGRATGAGNGRPDRRRTFPSSSRIRPMPASSAPSPTGSICRWTACS
jgi:3-oxoacyl-[acyl-carrier-protein] synthase-3